MINYTNEQEAIRQSFANFLGALLSNSIYENDEAKENVIALLCEELVKYAQEGNTINLNVSKPILKATLWILQKRKQEIIMYLNDSDLCSDLCQNTDTTFTSQYTKDIDNLIDLLDGYIDKIKGGK